MCHAKITFRFRQEIELPFQPCSHFCVPTTCRRLQERFRCGGASPVWRVVVQIDGSWSKSEVVVQILGRGPRSSARSAQRWREDVSAGAGAVRAAEIRLLMGAVTLLAARRVGGATLGVRRELLRSEVPARAHKPYPCPHPSPSNPKHSRSSDRAVEACAASSLTLARPHPWHLH